jgi:hypothetical protein
MFDTTRMITNIVATDAKKRFSQIKIISAHGGGLPLLRPPSRMVGKPASAELYFAASNAWCSRCHLTRRHASQWRTFDPGQNLVRQAISKGG